MTCSQQIAPHLLKRQQRAGEMRVSRMEKKDNRRTRMTKLLLKNSLIELLRQKPFARITIKDLCDQADLNRSTFYLHYTDQTELLREVEQQAFSNAMQDLEKVDADKGTLPHIVSFLDSLRDNRELFGILLYHPESQSFQRILSERMIEILQTNLPLNNTAAEQKYVYGFLVQGCMSMLRTWMDADFDLSSRELAELMFRLSDAATDKVPQ
jgi:AcrR family transcriptional regulator